MKNKAIVALAVASAILSPLVSAKEVTRSDLFESTFSVGYKTRDTGAGVNLDADWFFSQNVGVYGSYHSVSGNDTFDTDTELERYGLAGDVEETLFPRRFSFDRSNVEYGFSLRHVFFDGLETPFSIYTKVGVVSYDYDDVEFLTAEAADSQNSGSSGSSDSSGTSNEPDVDSVVVLSIPSTEAIKVSLGTKFFVNNRTTFDVSYSQYEIDSNYSSAEKTSEGSVDVEVGYFPRKNFGVSFMYESSDITGEPTYNIQATVRW
tara:strand:+ start:8754 stop:9539 length:786 start_codon:yes stop_codon:yes gene_type:complete